MTGDAIEQFRDALQRRAIVPPGQVITDGKLHRCDAEARNGKGDAAYVLHLDGLPAGGFQNWQDGLGWQDWRVDLGRPYTVTEQQAHEARVAVTRLERATEDERRRAEARERAEAVWAAAQTAPADHPYLVRKGVIGHGLKLHHGALVVPLRDAAGMLHSLQFIGPNGDKKFLTGGKKAGCYFAIGKPEEAICITEGYATGASIFEATGLPVAVAFDAGNLEPVARALRETFPELRILVGADDDETGRTKATDAARAVGGLIAIPDFGTNRPDHVKDFNDLCQLRGREAVERAVTGAQPPDTPTTLPATSSVQTANQTGDSQNGGSGDFFGGKKGVFYRDDHGESHWICSTLRVTALVRDKASENWGRLLEFDDADDTHHAWSMPMEVLRGSGEDLRGELLRLGLRIAPGSKARTKLAEFITTASPQARARGVNRTGWHDNVFVFPDSTIGERDERVIYQAESARRHYATRGTLADWQARIAQPCSGNSRLLLAVSTGFAAMLLAHAGAESGGLHFVGESSAGKTTALRVAASVYGGHGYLNRWRATTNGLEALAALHSDTLLLVDELAQVDPREAGEIAYMLANGAGKARAGRGGGARALQSWRLLFLSAGEIGLAQHMRDGGKKARAGQEMRLLDLPADAGKGRGIFDTLHGSESGAAFSKELNDATAEYYGTAAPAFLRSILADLSALPTWLRTQSKAFVETHLPADASGQAHRACERFALIGIAGELATANSITGWQPGEAVEAAARIYREWLEHRGGAGNQERAAMLAGVRAFFEQHGEARFTDLAYPNGRDTINRAGFRRKSADGEGIEYLVLPEAFKREVCAGFEPKHVTQALLDAGWLELGTDNKPQKREQFPDMGRTRCYVLTPAMWRA